MADFLRRLPDEQFLMHGSVHQLDVLEPRQAFGYSDAKGQNLNAVYATSLVEIAIIKAIVTGEPATWGWKFDCGRFGWRTLPLLGGPVIWVMGEIRLNAGYVYIVSRKDFDEVSPSIFVSNKSVQPLMVAEVTPMFLCEFAIRFKGAILYD